MFHDVTVNDPIHVDCCDLHGFACWPRAEPTPHMGPLRCHLSYHPLPLSNLSIDRQVKVRVSLPHTQYVVPSPIEASGGSDAPIDFDILRRNELGSSGHIPGFHYVVEVTADDEFVLVTCHLAAIVAERDGDKPRQTSVANTLNTFRNGVVGVIEWLGGSCVIQIRQNLPIVLRALDCSRCAIGHLTERRKGRIYAAICVKISDQRPMR